FHTYPYYNAQKHTLDFSQMCDAILKLPEKSVILLHACCHNPTGVDLSSDQWKELSVLMKRNKHLPFFDFAYQGFGRSLEEDAFAVRYFMQQRHEMFVATSYAKNLGLYGERVGMLAVFSDKGDVLKSIASQLKQL